MKRMVILSRTFFFMCLVMTVGFYGGQVLVAATDTSSSSATNPFPIIYSLFSSGGKDAAIEAAFAGIDILVQEALQKNIALKSPLYIPNSSNPIVTLTSPKLKNLTSSDLSQVQGATGGYVITDQITGFNKTLNIAWVTYFMSDGTKNRALVLDYPSVKLSQIVKSLGVSNPPAVLDNPSFFPTIPAGTIIAGNNGFTFNDFKTKIGLNAIQGVAFTSSLPNTGIISPIGTLWNYIGKKTSGSPTLKSIFQFSQDPVTHQIKSPEVTISLPSGSNLLPSSVGFVISFPLTINLDFATFEQIAQQKNLPKVPITKFVQKLISNNAQFSATLSDSPTVGMSGDIFVYFTSVQNPLDFKLSGDIAKTKLEATIELQNTLSIANSDFAATLSVPWIYGSFDLSKLLPGFGLGFGLNLSVDNQVVDFTTAFKISFGTDSLDCALYFNLNKDLSITGLLKVLFNHLSIATGGKGINDFKMANVSVRKDSKFALATSDGFSFDVAKPGTTTSKPGNSVGTVNTTTITVSKGLAAKLDVDIQGLFDALVDLNLVVDDFSQFYIKYDLKSNIKGKSITQTLVDQLKKNKTKIQDAVGQELKETNDLIQQATKDIQSKLSSDIVRNARQLRDATRCCLDSNCPKQVEACKDKLILQLKVAEEEAVKKAEKEISDASNNLNSLNQKYKITSDFANAVGNDIDKAKNTLADALKTFDLTEAGISFSGADLKAGKTPKITLIGKVNIASKSISFNVKDEQFDFSNVGKSIENVFSKILDAIKAELKKL